MWYGSFTSSGCKWSHILSLLIFFQWATWAGRLLFETSPLLDLSNCTGGKLLNIGPWLLNARWKVKRKHENSWCCPAQLPTTLPSVRWCLQAQVPGEQQCHPTLGLPGPAPPGHPHREINPPWPRISFQPQLHTVSYVLGPRYCIRFDFFLFQRKFHFRNFGVPYKLWTLAGTIPTSQFNSNHVDSEKRGHHCLNPSNPQDSWFPNNFKLDELH